MSEKKTHILVVNGVHYGPFTAERAKQKYDVLIHRYASSEEYAWQEDIKELLAERHVKMIELQDPKDL